MSALARWFNLNQKAVAGYDRTKTTLTEQLEGEGMAIHYDDDPEQIPKPFITNKSETLIIYTPAIPSEHSELKFFMNEGFELRKRSEVLGEITRERTTVAIAGTHGKTTTASMVAHILKESGRDMVAFLGGIATNYDSNFIHNNPNSPNAIVVAEADEFDRSFLKLHPDIGVITAMDADHLDIYGDSDSMEESFKEFANRIAEEGCLFVNHKIASKFQSDKFTIKSYSMVHGDLRSDGLRIKSGNYILDYQNGLGSIEDLTLSVPGYHNVENLIAAIGVCIKLGLSKTEIAEAVSSYKGVKRRFEFIIKSQSIVFVDDYAHHPVEIDAFLRSLKSLYPGRKVTAVFQPHLFSRTSDFAREFGESLSLADKVILTEIYPARELPVPGVTSELIFEHISSNEKLLCKKEELPELIKNDKSLEILATVGAGDIDQMVSEIKKILTEKYELEK